MATTATGFQHLTPDEPRSLFRLKQARAPVAEISSYLGRHRSTNCRELAHNCLRNPETARARRRSMSKFSKSQRALRMVAVSLGISTVTRLKRSEA